MPVAVPKTPLMASGASVPEPSPAATEPLPASLWPAVDEYLDEPDEIERWERVDGRKKQALPAEAGHGDPHFKLDALVDAHLAEGYLGSTDLKTRVDVEHEYASDTCVRKEGIDPATGKRHLEALVFEVEHPLRDASTTPPSTGVPLDIDGPIHPSHRGPSTGSGGAGK